MKYDIVVGSGPGGYVAAIRASQLGRSGARGAGRSRGVCSTGAASTRRC
ncbi:MAG: hypothetical protein ACLRMJ_01585 [Alistipes finegoldii]